MTPNLDLAPTTELEAVNICLAAIGESPVSSVEVDGLEDASSALQKLREASRAFQTEGWSFNSDHQYPVTRTVDGEIVLPTNALHADVSRSEGLNGVWRGGKLWDKDKHTFVWPRDVKLDVIWLLAFDDLPEPARAYVAVRAARLFARQQLGGEETEKYSKDDEMRAWVRVVREENRAADRNVFRNNMMLDRSSHHVYIPDRFSYIR